LMAKSSNTISCCIRELSRSRTQKVGLDDGDRIISSTRNRWNNSAVKIKGANQPLTVIFLVETVPPGKRTPDADTDEVEAVVT
jgi:hypothetical protein